MRFESPAGRQWGEGRTFFSAFRGMFLEPAALREPQLRILAALETQNSAMPWRPLIGPSLYRCSSRPQGTTVPALELGSPRRIPLRQSSVPVLHDLHLALNLVQSEVLLSTQEAEAEKHRGVASCRWATSGFSEQAMGPRRCCVRASEQSLYPPTPSARSLP